MSLRKALDWSGADSALLRFVLVVLLGFQVVHGLFLLAWSTGLVPAATSAGLNVLTRDLPSGTVPHSPDVAVRGDVTVEGAGGMEIAFHDPSVAERVMLVAPALLTALAAGLVAYLLLRMVLTLDGGDPFVPANVRRMYAIALTVVTGALAVPAAEALLGAVLEHRALGTDATVVFSLSLDLDGGVLPLVAVGLVIAALAEVFRRGTRLREDVEGLV
ncbi:DUF2975 domain-containing protein [Nocardiopsis dassonvillei]|uniref:DUF2975 domain-containing protein n=1 Tax=Nocardiopsis dassonvillei TaxID=2014 RepID=UPI0033E537E6